MKAEIQALEKDENQVFKLLERNLYTLTDLKYVYHQCTTLQKHELIRKGFDCNLYYQNGIYRTPSVNPILRHNELKLKEKRLLEIDKNEKGDPKVPLCGGEGTLFEYAIPILEIITELNITR